MEQELSASGCRLSEALALTADRVLVFESLKKRRAGIFRSVYWRIGCCGCGTIG
jgi:hypothetical protein